MKRILLALVAVLSLSVAAMAADITGKWTREAPAAPAAGAPPAGGQGRGGGRGGFGGGTYNFKVEGAKLTGTIEGGRGPAQEISDGKISGDDISFTVTRTGQDGTPVKTEYKGKVNGDKIELTFEFAGRGPITMNLVKAAN